MFSHKTSWLSILPILTIFQLRSRFGNKLACHSKKGFSIMSGSVYGEEHPHQTKPDSTVWGVSLCNTMSSRCICCKSSEKVNAIKNIDHCCVTSNPALRRKHSISATLMLAFRWWGDTLTPPVMAHNTHWERFTEREVLDKAPVDTPPPPNKATSAWWAHI